LCKPGLTCLGASGTLDRAAKTGSVDITIGADSPRRKTKNPQPLGHAGFLNVLGGDGVCHSAVERCKNPSFSLTVPHVLLF
jgi:hypothetical protein